MANLPFSNQYEVNRRSGQAVQNILQKSVVVIYEVIKWFFNFCGQMVRQFLGK